MAEKKVDPYGVGNYEAPPGQIWVCGACGKTSRDKYGEKRISRGWDESCMMNAVLCHDPPEMKDNQPQWKAVEVDSPALKEMQRGRD